MIGETDLLLVLAVDFLVDADLLAERFALLAGVVVGFFFIDDGVVFAFEDFGLGVPLIGFDDLFAGVAVCLAIFYFFIKK